MYCKTCGKPVEKPIEYTGAKVCPYCGCVMELIETVKSNVGKGQYTYRKKCCVRVLVIFALLLNSLEMINNILTYYLFSENNKTAFQNLINNFSFYDFMVIISFVMFFICCIGLFISKNRKKVSIILIPLLCMIVFRLIDLIRTKPRLSYYFINVDIFILFSCIIAIVMLIFTKKNKFIEIVLLTAHTLYGLCRLFYQIKSTIDVLRIWGDYRTSSMTFYYTCPIIYSVSYILLMVAIFIFSISQPDDSIKKTTNT